MARHGVIDGAVIFEVMVKPSSRIDGTRVVEPHGLLDMLQQKTAAAEIRRGNGHKNLGSMRKARKVQEPSSTLTAFQMRFQIKAGRPTEYAPGCRPGSLLFSRSAPPPASRLSSHRY